MNKLTSVVLMLTVPPLAIAILLTIYVSQSTTAESALEDFRSRDNLIDSVMLIAPRSRYYISYYKNKRYDKIMNFNGVIYGRYRLSATVPIDLDEDGKIRSRGEALFYLAEIKSVEVLPTKQVSIRLDGVYREFSEQEWWDVYHSEGDWSVLGIELIKDAPVKGVELMPSEREYLSRNPPPAI